MEHTRTYEGNGLKYLNERVSALFQQMGSYNARLAGNYVLDVILKLRSYDFSPVKVTYVEFCFLRESDILDFMNKLPRTLTRIGNSFEFVFKDEYEDVLCRVLLRTKASFQPLLRLAWLYCDRHGRITTSHRWDLQEVIDDGRYRRAVFTNFELVKKLLDDPFIDRLLSDKWRLYKLNEQEQKQEVFICRKSNGCTMYDVQK